VQRLLGYVGGDLEHLVRLAAPAADRHV
jgi:hypothetical protein